MNESGLSRVWQQFSDANRQAGILTAFRSEYSLEENRSRNRSLAAEVRAKGWGFVYIDGHWVENEGTPNEQLVSEESLLVSTTSSVDNFSRELHQLGNKWDQEAVLVKTPKGASLIFKSGSSTEIGQVRPGQLGTIYSQLRNNRKANTFIFKEERVDIGWLARLAGIKKD